MVSRAELVVPSKDAVALQKGGGLGAHVVLVLWAEVGEGGRRGCMDRWGRLTIRAPSPNHQGTLA